MRDTHLGLVCLTISGPSVSDLPTVETRPSHQLDFALLDDVAASPHAYAEDISNLLPATG
jgi:hypothetical protein